MNKTTEYSFIKAELELIIDIFSDLSFYKKNFALLFRFQTFFSIVLNLKTIQ